ncbi:ArnT family glycosyltransferase [Flavihumibacter profundi]|uniref:ArnT family glycosyltransferase n=1 Tax=Flavihumibacter profundi TaxID=2716883 RepID=UPI001CC34064|nr:glycosyltransferase family 39 protein [Flavihumibacter profundi]MBZ5859042.1 glycosyltransferase family 39 protein [Flavihumibacter profundi]
MSSIARSVRQHPSIWFYSCWLLVNLVQAAGTELLNDEAYYWVYSKYLDWGYFDHPPMIAVLIKLGYSIFHNELGVRLFMALMNTATIFIIQKLLLRDNERLFFAIVLSMGVLQIGGILAVPDIPLAFFTALFFWQYKRFLQNTDLLQSVLLGVVMALMLYSKYHGILIIFFTFISNRKLALQWPAWLAAIIGALLFSPHLWWQFTHDFPSVQYHLKERNAPSYQFAFTLEYIGGQILLAGPLIGWLLLYAAGKFRTSDPFARALKWSMAGFYGFFLVSTLKGRVEANWTVPALVPLIILAHAWLSDSGILVRWVYRLMSPTILIIVIVRIYMLTDISFFTSRFNDEMHHNRSWAAAIREKANGLPVVFLNSYQRPSKYWFYTCDASFGLNTTMYRRNNYNFWPIEEKFQGRQVFVVDNLVANEVRSIPIITDRGNTAGIVAEHFESHSALRFQSALPSLEIENEKLVPFPLTIYPDTLGQALLNPSSPGHVTAVLDIFMGDSLMARVEPEFTRTGGQWECSFSKKIALENGSYRAKIGLASSLPGFFSQNSASLPIKVIK